MSCRQAVRNSDTAAKERTTDLVWFSVRGNGGDLPRVERLEKATRRLQIELRIRRLDAEEEPVAAGERETWHVEDRVVRLRQAVEREHAEHRGQRRDENRALEGDRDECRPAVERLSADVQGIRRHRHPVPAHPPTAAGAPSPPMQPTRPPISTTSGSRDGRSPSA